MQTKTCYKLFYFAWEETSNKFLKVATARNPFPIV